MPPDEIWEDAWLNNKLMPPHRFPAELLDVLLTSAEEWMADDSGTSPRIQLQEFVSKDRSHAILEGLLYSGFCRDRAKPQRLRPIPVIVQVVYRAASGIDESLVPGLMREILGRVLSEWHHLHASGGKYEVAP